MRRWQPVIVLFLILWATCLPALDALPLHNDEGLHLTRAVEVWNLHPFWQINHGKIINNWLIAAFYPQNAPVFVGRIATIFLGMIGMAAGWSIARQTAGLRGAMLAAVVWLTCPYLFFYERLALSDAEVGSLVLLTVWSTMRLVRTKRMRDAALTGVIFGITALFKLTALPFTALIVLVILGFSRESLARRFQYLVVIALGTAAVMAVPLTYLALREPNFIDIARGWLGDGSGAKNGGLDNLARLWAAVTGFGTPIWLLFTFIGLIALPIFGGRRGVLLLVGYLIPLATLTFLGSEVLPRHYVVALPLALVLGSAGLALAIQKLVHPQQRWLAVGAVSAVVAALFPAFALQAYRDPANLPMPQGDREEYVTTHSSGYGLREAVLALPTVTTANIPVIASMFPDGCRRANFYAVDGRTLTCTQASGRAEIEAALSTYGDVYVLTDTSPSIGIDVSTLDAQAEQIAQYPRPGETDASVVLWRLTR